MHQIDTCGTCAHYRKHSLHDPLGYCYWLEDYPGMRPEVPKWVSRAHPYPVYPREGARCPQWREDQASVTVGKTA